jgi:hypothetical protein
MKTFIRNSPYMSMVLFIVIGAIFGAFLYRLAYKTEKFDNCGTEGGRCRGRCAGSLVKKGDICVNVKRYGTVGINRGPCYNSNYCQHGLTCRDKVCRRQ